MLEYLHGPVVFAFLQLNPEPWEIRLLNRRAYFRSTRYCAYSYTVLAGRIVTSDWYYRSNDEYVIAVAALKGGIVLLTREGEQYLYEHDKQLRPYYLPFSCFETTD